MSQIEVCSRVHTGKVIVTTLQGEKEIVEFKQVEPRLYVAVVSEDAAEILLGKLGAPDYFKLGPVELTETPADETESTGEEIPGGTETEEEVPDAPAVINREAFDAATNVTQLKALVEQCEDRELLMELVAAEIGADKPRKTYTDALNARIDALTVQA